MKEKYMKPRMIVETFELTQSIAQTCDVNKTNHTSYGVGYPTTGNIMNCAWSVDDLFFYFTDNVNTCTTKAGENGVIFDVYCYNNPTDNTQIFNSI